MSSINFPPLTFWKLVAVRTKGETGIMVDKNISTHGKRESQSSQTIKTSALCCVDMELL